MWEELRRKGIVVRPFAGPAPTGRGVTSPFGAALSATLEVLERELRMLGARTIVLEVGIDESQFRLDGMPRADARSFSPAVSLSFESRWGPLRYTTGEYGRWQDNLRAIALSMESLRRVDRYGVSKRGEQYQGWKALPPGGAPMDRETAIAVLAPWNGNWRAAAAETHPDRGGDTDTFTKVMQAKEAMER